MTRPLLFIASSRTGDQLAAIKSWKSVSIALASRSKEGQIGEQ